MVELPRSATGHKVVNGLQRVGSVVTRQKGDHVYRREVNALNEAPPQNRSAVRRPTGIWVIARLGAGPAGTLLSLE